MYYDNFDGKKHYYIPYYASMRHLKKSVWHVTFNGGEANIDLSATASVLFLGVNKTTGALPLYFIDQCNHHKTQIIVCKTHQSEPALPGYHNFGSRDDVLTRQIILREHQRKCAYVARTLVKGCFQGRERVCRVAADIDKRLGEALHDIQQIRLLEAEFSREYWRGYYKMLDLDIHRREEHPVNTALDALSRYLSGVLLRWIVQAGLSPYHGFLHTSTRYCALSYDLMEPLRWILEKACANAWQHKPGDVVAQANKEFKVLLDEVVFTEPSKQKVKRRALIRGNVIALTYYLMRKNNKLIWPFEVKDLKGRPFKSTYTLPGHIWTK